MSAADERRIAACLSAFDGIPTEKIEGKTVAEVVAEEAYITGLQGGFLGLEGGACGLLAGLFAGQFEGEGATNFLEIRLHHPALGPFVVTMQRQAGETPGQKLAQLKAELASLQESWIAVHDLLPPCRKQQLYIGINSNGYAGVFNAIADVAGDVHCMYETPEGTADVLSGLVLWRAFTPPSTASDIAARSGPGSMDSLQGTRK